MTKKVGGAEHEAITLVRTGHSGKGRLMTNKMNIDALDVTLADPNVVQQLTEEVATGNRVAAQVHRSLLPAPVRHPQIDIDVVYLPIDAVSGIYCQVVFPVPSRCYITMCEVRGDGIGAALLATRVSSEVRRFALDQMRPMAIVKALSLFVYEYFHETNMCLSFVAAQIDLANGTISYSGAGHPSVLQLRRHEGLVCALDSQNSLIGVDANCLADEPENTRPFVAGDQLLFYTSGLIRSVNADGVRLGQSGLAKIASDAQGDDAFETADQILDHVVGFRNGPSNDDMILVVAAMK